MDRATVSWPSSSKFGPFAEILYLTLIDVQDTEALSYLVNNENLSLLRGLSLNGRQVNDRELTPLFMSDRTWDHLKAAFLLLEQLCLLYRFADGNNPEALQEPLPDGTNLESPALRSSWILQRAWVRAL